MSAIKLVKPHEKYARQVMDYKAEMEANKDSLDGCADLEDCGSYAEWAEFERRGRNKYGDGYTPSEVFLAVRESDDRLVGIIDFRHPITGFLLEFGGSIGYSVRPSERRKGYATDMLRLILPVCREFGEQRVLLTCDKINEGSRRTIIKNGGILENVVEDTPGLGKSGFIERYWIET